MHNKICCKSRETSKINNTIFDMIPKNDAADSTGNHLTYTNIDIMTNNWITNLLMTICCRKPVNRGKDDGEWMEPILSHSAKSPTTPSISDDDSTTTASLSPPTPHKFQQAKNVINLPGPKPPLPIDDQQDKERVSSSNKRWGNIKHSFDVKSTATHWATKEAGVKWDEIVQRIGSNGEIDIDIDELDNSLHDDEVYNSVNTAAKEGFNHASHLDMGDGFMDSQLDLSDYKK